VTGAILHGRLTAYCQRLVDVLDRRIADAVTEDVDIVGDIDRGALLVVKLGELATVGGEVRRRAHGVDPCGGRPGVEDERQLLRRRPDLDLDPVSCPVPLVEHLDFVLSPAQVRARAGDGSDGRPDDAVASGDDPTGLGSGGDRWRQQRRGENGPKHGVVLGRPGV
jgi:hypothetical protein